MAVTTPPMAPVHASSELPRMRARYLTQALELEEHKTPHVVQAGILVSTALVIGALVWAAWTQVPEIARAQGVVEPRGEIHKIQHLEGGIVDKLLVANGDHVSAGQLLATLAVAPAASEKLQMEARSAGLQLRLARLEAQLKNTRVIAFPPAAAAAQASLAGREEQLFQEITASRRSQQQVLELSRQRYLEEGMGVRRQRDALGAELSALQSKLAMYAEGNARNVVPRGDLLDLEARLARTKSDYQELESMSRSAEMTANEAARKVEEFLLGAREQDHSDIEKASAELAELGAAEPRSVDRVGRLEMRASHPGLVKGLSINGAGAVIEPGGVLLEIVPDDVPLEVSAEVSTLDVGHVHEGQEVEVSVHSYEQQRFGTVKGHVRQVSASTYLDREQRPFYRAKVELERSYVGDTPSRAPLVAGMTVEARIILGRKSVLDYLLAPVYRGFEQAFRER